MQAGGGGGGGFDIKRWWREQPPVTRLLLKLLCFLTLLPLGGISPAWFALDFYRILCGQVWRPVTAMIYHGPIDVGLLFHVWMFSSSSRELEAEHFEYDIVRYLWFLIVQCAALSVLCLLIGMPFTSHCVAPMLLFVRCRSRPAQEMRFYFDIRVRAIYFPLVFACFHLLLGSPIVADAIGFVIGHLYVYHCVLRHEPGTFLPLQGCWETPEWVLRQLRKMLERRRPRPGSMEPAL
eukprot:TRINITY_DN8668_c0_g1_i1.p1 TRINITY_DN8668_c0_g1~~TRINITY_DN8668_c0_g1_i1.p1  ORF type:complete len:260 (+),score=90.38 TRINITY_DN8668_c0_g1_i1:74-781(+)